MKLCLSTLSCPEWNLRRIIKEAETLGIAGIDFRGIGADIDITELPEFNENLDATLARLADAKLEMPCLNTSIALVTPLPDRWTQMLDEARRSADLAARTGTKLLRVFGGGVPKSISGQEAGLLARRHLRQLMKVAHAANCRVLVETHDDWATSSEMLELVQDFDPADVGVLWDIEHPYRKGEVPAQTQGRLSRYIGHVHVKDSIRVEGRNIPKLLGEGDLPIRDCLNLLKSSGYAGWISLECEKRWHADAPGPELSLPAFVTYMSSY